LITLFRTNCTSPTYKHAMVLITIIVTFFKESIFTVLPVRKKSLLPNPGYTWLTNEDCQIKSCPHGTADNNIKKNRQRGQHTVLNVCTENKQKVRCSTVYSDNQLAYTTA